MGRTKRPALLEGVRKATNVTVDARLLAKAKELGINLSALLEEALREEVLRRVLEDVKVDPEGG